jgi:hypothetical protein
MASTTATEQGQESVATAAPEAQEPVKRRTRRYRKRTKFQHVPRMPWPVKALWDSASEEEQRLAHRTCTSLLELWLSKATKQEVMERLQIPALRLWQLSQQALAGMVAGLLKQPKRRPPPGEVPMPNPEEDGKLLRRRNAELEKENRILKDLLQLMRELPSNRERAAASKAPRRREEVETSELPGAPDPPASSPPASEPAPAETKRPAKRPRGRPKMDRGAAPERPDPVG